MQWRRELNRSLEDELDSLGHRRDMFIQGVESSCATDETATRDITRFEKWLSEERRRLVRATELRCEECWRKAVTAGDDMGRTPLHYAASARSVLRGEEPPSAFFKYTYMYSFKLFSFALVCLQRHANKSLRLHCQDGGPLAFATRVRLHLWRTRFLVRSHPARKSSQSYLPRFLPPYMFLLHLCV